MKLIRIFGIFCFGIICMSQQGMKENTLKIGRLKYNGGGDWYSSRTALPNLANFCNAQLKTNIQTQEAIVEAGSEDVFLYPYLFVTGHGTILLSESEAENLRTYMEGGGFIHFCDNFGMDISVRKEIKRIFPNDVLVEVPFTNPIYNSTFSFPNGLPKVHKHSGKQPKGLGIFKDNRLVLFYDYECDLGNGWEDAETYNDPFAIREKALQMGANLVEYAFNGGK